MDEEVITLEEARQREAEQEAAGNPLRSRALFWPELRKLPRPEYLVKGVLDAGTLAEIFGPTSCGKSFLGTDIGLHIAVGWDWNGHKVRQAGVLYVNAEGGAAIVNRLDAWQRHHGESLDDIAFAVVLEPTSLLDKAGVDQVIADAGKVPDLRLIVIDTAARVMPGGDEGSESMSLFVAACDRIRAETGATVLVIHHSGKDASKGSRGSTVLPFGADTVIEVSHDATTKVATVHLNKQRDGDTGELLSFKLKVIELGTDADDDLITSCVIEATDKGASRSQRKVSGQAKVALDLLIRAITDAGEIPPASNHIPGQIKVVPLTLWRQYCFEGLVGDRDNRDTIRRAFNRNIKKLQELGAIGTWQDWVWPAGQPGQGGTT